MIRISSGFESIFVPKHLIAALFLCATAISPPIQASIEHQRLLFHDAALALELNQISKFNRLLKLLDDYPAKPYLEYDAFKRKVKQIKPQQAELFFRRFADYPFVYHARGKWLNALARRGDWENFLEFFDDREGTRLRCLAFRARLKLGQVEGLNDEIAKVWLRGYSQPAFKHLLANHAEPEKIIWLRIEKAFKSRRPNLARYLSKKLEPQSRAIVETWYQAHLRPERSLKKLADKPDTERNRAIIVHAIDRLARKDSLKALEFWNLIRDQFAFSQQQRDHSQLRIALSAAYQHEPVARAIVEPRSGEHE